MREHNSKILENDRLVGLILPDQIHQLFPRTTFPRISAHSRIPLLISESFPHL